MSPRGTTHSYTGTTCVCVHKVPVVKRWIRKVLLPFNCFK
jgi:hypothetical protein